LTTRETAKNSVYILLVNNLLRSQHSAVGLNLFRIRFCIRIRPNPQCLFRIRIQNVYFGSGSYPDQSKNFGSLRIRIRDTDEKYIYKKFKVSLFLGNVPTLHLSRRTLIYDATAAVPSTPQSSL
jgi:hypothetical protein